MLRIHMLWPVHLVPSQLNVPQAAAIGILAAAIRSRKARSADRTATMATAMMFVFAILEWYIVRYGSPAGAIEFAPQSALYLIFFSFLAALGAKIVLFPPSENVVKRQKKGDGKKRT